MVWVVGRAVTDSGVKMAMFGPLAQEAQGAHGWEISPLKQSLERGSSPLWKRGVRVTQLTNQSPTVSIELVNFLLKGAEWAGKEIILVCCVEPREVKDAGKRKKMSLISENKPLQSQNYWNQPCRQVNKIGKNRRRLLMSRPAAWEGSKWWRSQKEAGKEGKASQIPIIKEQESPPSTPTWNGKEAHFAG